MIVFLLVLYAVITLYPYKLYIPIYIIDGDTIQVRKIKGGDFERPLTIRYACIDTPEKDEPFYEEALLKNKELIDNRLLLASFLDKDRYGRRVEFIYAYSDSFLGKIQAVFSAGGILLNKELLEAGLAIYYDISGKCKRYPQLLSAQRRAFENKLGLWKLYYKYKDKQVIKGRYTFHLENCMKIQPTRKKEFIRLGEAIHSGLSPCRSCKPLIAFYYNDYKR